jgi:glutamate formiminotransferase
MLQHEPIVECVVNINHRQDDDFIEALVNNIDAFGTKVAHVDQGRDAQRTVLTIISPVREMGRTLDIIYEQSHQEQDINTYSGNHPSAGIVDVVPFVPMRDLDKASLKAWVNKWAKQISTTYKVPIVFYGELNSRPGQKHLSEIRRGGPDIADQRLQAGELISDFGPSSAHHKLGISSWTVRDYMAAYNVSLNSNDLQVAKNIAKDIRKLRQHEDQLRDVRVLGWLTEEYGCVQISANLYNLSQMTMEGFYNVVRGAAQAHDVDLLGSELIGMTPLQGISEHCDQGNVDSIINDLGLHYHGTFIKEKRILDYMI